MMKIMKMMKMWDDEDDLNKKDEYLQIFFWESPSHALSEKTQIFLAEVRAPSDTLVQSFETRRRLDRTVWLRDEDPKVWRQDVVSKYEDLKMKVKMQRSEIKIWDMKMRRCDADATI